ncbi:hypothetical protein OIU84_028129, partial [Salix udensis]
MNDNTNPNCIKSLLQLANAQVHPSAALNP